MRRLCCVGMSSQRSCDLLASSDVFLLLDVERVGLDLTLSLQLLHRGFVLPAHTCREVAQLAALVLRLKAQDPVHTEKRRRTLVAKAMMERVLLQTRWTHLRASGTTARFIRSYGGGMPSNAFNRSSAAWPRLVLCGIILWGWCRGQSACRMQELRLE